MIFVSISSSDLYSVWNNFVMLDSFEDQGIDLSKVQILIFTPKDRVGEDLSHWDKIKEIYPTVQWYHYTDNIGECWGAMSLYKNIFRMWVMIKHHEAFPELKSYFFHDNDIILHKPLDLERYLNDDITYWSDTTAYTGAAYVYSKERDVRKEKLELYKKRDIWQELLKLVDPNLNKKDVEQYDHSTGGCQILYKNVDKEFWEKVFETTLSIKVHLDDINNQFFPSHDQGFQSFVADMIAPAMTLWSRKQSTKVIPELCFTWSVDPKEHLSISSILHNAGVTADKNLFFKGKAVYINNTHTPLDESEQEYIDRLLEDTEVQKYAQIEYIKQIKKVYKKWHNA